MQVKKENFFKRHKKFTILLLAMIVMNLFASILSMSGISENLGDNLLVVTICLSVAVYISGMVIVIKKVGRGGQKVLSRSYKSQLEYDGQQYWYVREYVRQALSRGELDKKIAITKIVNTNLAQRLPDTVDEIEANAFYYRQKKEMI